MEISRVLSHLFDFYRLKSENIIIIIIIISVDIGSGIKGPCSLKF